MRSLHLAAQEASGETEVEVEAESWAAARTSREESAMRLNFILMLDSGSEKRDQEYQSNQTSGFGY